MSYAKQLTRPGARIHLDDRQPVCDSCRRRRPGFLVTFHDDDEGAVVFVVCRSCALVVERP